MATVKADLAQPGIPARYQEKGVFAVVSTYEASALPSGDVIEMCKVQAGVTVIDVLLVFDDLSSGTTLLSVGDGTTPARFIDAADADSGQNAARMTKFPFTYTADDTIDVTLSGGDAATGTITLVVYMTAEEVDLV
jgi:hypothetical protein